MSAAAALRREPPRAREDASLLERYLRDVRRVPPLGRDEEKRRAQELLDQRDAVARLLEALPEAQETLRHLRENDFPGALLRELAEELARGARRRRGGAAQRRRAARAIHALGELRSHFVAANLRLVVFLSRPYRNAGLPWLDLIQEGNLGLVRAVEKYDVTRGFKFSSYAVWWIEQAFVRAVQRHSRTIRLPAHVHGELAARRRAEARLHARLGRDARPEELAGELGIDCERAEELREFDEDPLSLDAPLRATGADVSEVIAAPLRDPGEEIDDARRRGRLGALLAHLDPRERSILMRRFGLEGRAETLAEIGSEVGLSRERVRQLERRALEKLRACAERPDRLSPLAGLALPPLEGVGRSPLEDVEIIS